MRGSKVFKITGWVILGIMIAGVLGLMLGIVVMALWNWLMPGLFGLPQIGYWQAVGIFILCHLLFKSHYGGQYQHEKQVEDRREQRFAERVRSMIHDGDVSPAAGPAEPVEQ